MQKKLSRTQLHAIVHTVDNVECCRDVIDVIDMATCTAKFKF
jgi:hypothetical protein